MEIRLESITITTRAILLKSHVELDLVQTCQGYYEKQTNPNRAGSCHITLYRNGLFGGSLTDSGRCPFRGGHERPKGCSGITLGQDTRRSEPIGTEEIRLDNGSQCRHTHPVSLGGLIHNKVPPDGGSAELERTTTDW